MSLSTVAAAKLLDRFPHLRETVGVVVCVTQTPDRRMPHNAAQVVAALGLPQSVASFDVSLGCSGYVYGLKVMEGFLTACGQKNGLLVTCDPYSRLIDARDRDTNCVFGDAAAATWVSVDEAPVSGTVTGRILGHAFGSGADEGCGLEIKAGGAALPFVQIAQDTTATYARDDLKLHMYGRNVFNFVQAKVPGNIAAALDVAGLNLEDIDHFVLHQGSTYMLQALSKRMKVPMDKVMINMDKYGNTVSSTLPICLSELERDGILEGRKVLLSGFGVGFSFGSLVVQF